MFLTFTILGSTAENYLTPLLTTIATQKLDLSETLAGVTILAFANGAPDIIFSISAGGFEGGVNFSIGALFGAGFFVTCIVFGRCIQLCKVLRVKPVELGRDIVFYIIAVATILIFAYVG